MHTFHSLLAALWLESLKPIVLSNCSYWTGREDKETDGNIRKGSVKTTSGDLMPSSDGGNSFSWSYIGGDPETEKHEVTPIDKAVFVVTQILLFPFGLDREERVTAKKGHNPCWETGRKRLENYFMPLYLHPLSLDAGHGCSCSSSVKGALYLAQPRAQCVALSLDWVRLRQHDKLRLSMEDKRRSTASRATIEILTLQTSQSEGFRLIHSRLLSTTGHTHIHADFYGNSCGRAKVITKAQS